MSIISPPRADDSFALERADRRRTARPATIARRADVARAGVPIPRGSGPRCSSLLAITAALYLWDLGASGWANSYYSAAVQAGTKSWKAFFFGSTDASNFITVDKTPASLWVMELSGRIFGVNAWSVLVPQALEGVAAVGVLFATVKRWFSPAAALIAGAVFALTPVAALMFRFNNPDALLVLLLVAGAYTMTRALEDGPHALDRGDRRARRLRLPRQGVAGVPRAARVRARVPARRPAEARRAASATSCVLGLTTLAAGGWWVAIVAAVARVEPSVHRRFAEQQLLERALRLQRFRPADRQRVGQRRRWRRPGSRAMGPDRDSRACSTRSSAARSRGSCRPR